MNYAQQRRPYAQRRAREIAGEFTRYELPELMAELRRIYYSRVARSAKYYRQPEPTPVPMGRPPLTFVTSSVSLVTFDGVRTDSRD